MAKSPSRKKKIQEVSKKESLKANSKCPQFQNRTTVNYFSRSDNSPLFLFCNSFSLWAINSLWVMFCIVTFHAFNTGHTVTSHGVKFMW